MASSVRTIATGAAASSIGQATISSTTTARFTPVRWWAALGLGIFVFEAYVVLQWMLSPDFAPVLPPLANEIEPWRGRLFGAVEIITGLLVLVCVGCFLVRPLIRERRLTTNGIVILIMPTVLFLDPIGQYIVPWWSYSSGFHNMGNWAAHIPGFLAPNIERMPEIYANAFAYFWGVGAPIIFIAWLMRWTKSHFPSTSTVRLLAVSFLAGCLYDVFLEIPPLYFQMYSYWGAVQAWSFFGGHYYQYPIYGMMLWGLAAAAMANVLYWVDDRGETFPERGLDRLRLSAPLKAAYRTFALIGAFVVINFFCYHLPAGLIALHGDSMPVDTPQHLRNRICGDGTDYLCPGPGRPIYKRPN